jgi:hypothetical protein
MEENNNNENSEKLPILNEIIVDKENEKNLEKKKRK